MHASKGRFRDFAGNLTQLGKLDASCNCAAGSWHMKLAVHPWPTCCNRQHKLIISLCLVSSQQPEA